MVRMREDKNSRQHSGDEERKMYKRLKNEILWSVRVKMRVTARFPS